MIRDTSGNPTALRSKAVPLVLGQSTWWQPEALKLCSTVLRWGGWKPALRGLLRGSRAGNLYGTTMIGGAGDSGVVYKLDPAGNETVLYNFTGLLSLAAKTSAAALYTR